MGAKGWDEEHGRYFWENLEAVQVFRGNLEQLSGNSGSSGMKPKLFRELSRTPGAFSRLFGRTRLLSMIPERPPPPRLTLPRFSLRWLPEVASHAAPPDVTSVRSGSGLRREQRLERPEGTAPCPRRHRSTGTSWRSRWGRSRWGPWPGSGTCWAGSWRRKALTRRTWCWGSSWCCARTRSCSGSGSRRRAGPTPNRAGTARAACASGATPSSEPRPETGHPKTPPEPLPAPPNPPLNQNTSWHPPKKTPNSWRVPAAGCSSEGLGVPQNHPGELKTPPGSPKLSRGPQNHLWRPQNLPRDPKTLPTPPMLHLPNPSLTASSAKSGPAGTSGSRRRREDSIMAAAAAASSRRRRRPRAHPNPLFARWLREWRDEARGTWARGTYERALRSLSRFPLPLRSGRAAAILQHFGPALCARLDQRLRQHRREQGLPATPPPQGRCPDPPPAPPTRRPRRPLPRSGSHALLLVLSQSPEPLPEAELLQQARPLCDHALTPAALGPLLRRGLVQRSGRPPRYELTPRGRSLAEATPPGQVCPQRPLVEQDENRAPSPPLCDPEQEFELRPGEFDIVLCADVTEANGPGGGVPALLRSLGVPVLLRRLHVGDFLWVAREKEPPPGRAPRELLLDVVVERKSAADLGSSLRDGRYREQKFRLRRSGLRCPVYLLEEPGEGEALPLPLPTLRQAAANTQVVDGFLVTRTRDPQDSAAYLGVLGEQLRRKFGERVLRAWGGDVTARGPPEPPGTPLTLLPFQRLREGGGKNQAQTVGAVFARQLLQLGGLSGGRAGAVLRRFPTPASLMAALGSSRDPQKCRELLSALRCGPAQRSLGPSLSGALVRLYGSEGPLA